MTINRREALKLFAGAAFAVTATGVVGLSLKPVGRQVGVMREYFHYRLDTTTPGWLAYFTATIGESQYDWMTMTDKDPRDYPAILAALREDAIHCFHRESFKPEPFPCAS